MEQRDIARIDFEKEQMVTGDMRLVHTDDIRILLNICWSEIKRRIKEDSL